MRRVAALSFAVALSAACLQTLPAAAEQTPAAVRLQAIAAMEELQEEIQVLAALRDAQEALLAWNRESARSGAALQALPAALCADPALAAWCALLPATFGSSTLENGHD